MTMGYIDEISRIKYEIIDKLSQIEIDLYESDKARTENVDEQDGYDLDILCDLPSTYFVGKHFDYIPCSILRLKKGGTVEVITRTEDEYERQIQLSDIEVSDLAWLYNYIQTFNNN